MNARRPAPPRGVGHGKARSVATRPPTRPGARVRPPSGSVSQAKVAALTGAIPIQPVVSWGRRSSGSAKASSATAVAAKPDVITWRLLLLSVVGLLLMGLLAPTLRGALDQHRQYTQLEAEYQEALVASDRLDIELARWDDPAYVESQARTRLSYVYQGDKVWRPIGTGLLAEDIDPATGLRVKQGIVGATSGQPWYLALLESIKVADGPVERPEVPDDLNALLPPRDE